MRHFSNRSLIALSLAFTAATGCGPTSSPSSSIDIANLQEAWDANNHPRLLHGKYVVKFSALPLAGQAAQAPWADSYWPDHRGGIANRWYGGQDASFPYPVLTRERIQAMNKHQLMGLSPAEKFDVLRGKYHFPLTKSEINRVHTSSDRWWGICHGWAAAAINFAEPKPTELVSADGIAVPFGSSDVKALLAYHQGTLTQPGRTKVLGARCDEDIIRRPDTAGLPQCRDVNAGSFHIILANFLGIDKKSLVVDITRDVEVWNQPLLAFKSTVVHGNFPIPARAAPGTTKIVRVATQMQFISGFGAWWNALPISKFPQQVATHAYEYALELNGAGEIIGGEWLTTKRPDFMWIQTAPKFTGEFAELEKLYKASVAIR